MNNIGDLINKKQSANQSAQQQLSQIRRVIVELTQINPLSIGFKDNQINIRISDSMQANELRLCQTELLEAVQKIEPTTKKLRLIVSNRS